MCREKVAIVAGDAPFFISEPFLQRLEAVLDLEQGQVTFTELGVTLNLEESATGHYVIDLMSGCADSITDETTPGNAGGPGKRSRNESVKVSEDAVDNSEFSNLICGSERERESDRLCCEQAESLIDGGWTARNLAADGQLEILRLSTAFFLANNECRKNQQRIQPAPGLSYNH